MLLIGKFYNRLILQVKFLLNFLSFSLEGVREAIIQALIYVS